jgi:hypothetical protein
MRNYLLELALCCIHAAAAAAVGAFFVERLRLEEACVWQRDPAILAATTAFGTFLGVFVILLARALRQDPRLELDRKARGLCTLSGAVAGGFAAATVFTIG